jgi:hypothetical protein
MAWIYLAESEESHLAWLPGSDLLPTVNVIPTRRAFSFPECGKERCRSLPSGTMCEHSMNLSYTHGLISFTEASHARILASQALAQAWQESEVAFSGRSLDCVANYDPALFFWKTYQQLLQEAAARWLGPLPRWGMTVDGALYPLRAPEHLTKGTDGFCWPTLRASDSKGCGPPGSKSFIHMTQRRYLCAVAKTEARGNLNPTWLEWFMGYRTKWTELDALVMPLFPNRRKKLL